MTGLDPSKFFKDKAKLLRRKTAHLTKISQVEALEIVAYSYTDKPWDWCAHQIRQGTFQVTPSTFSLSRFEQRIDLSIPVAQGVAEQVFNWGETIPSLSVTISSATEADAQEVLNWLKEEQGFRPNGNGFYSYDRIIAEHYSEGELKVAKTIDGYPVGFITGPACSPELLAVKRAFQRRGVGKQLLEYMILKAKSEGECAMRVEVTPSISIPFFQKLGFERARSSSSSGFLGWLKFESSLPVPEGKQVQVVIKFYNLDKKRKSSAPPIQEHHDVAIQDASGLIHLTKRISLSYPTDYSGNDRIVSIEIDGKQIYCDKAKYPQARLLGVKGHSHGFYIDVIKQPHSVIEYGLMDGNTMVFPNVLESFPNCRHLYTTLYKLHSKGQSYEFKGFSNTLEERVYSKLLKKSGGHEADLDQSMELEFCLKHAGINGFMFALRTIPQFGDQLIDQLVAKVLLDIEPLVLKRFPEDNTIKETIKSVLTKEKNLAKPFYELFPDQLDLTANMIRRVIEDTRYHVNSSSSRGYHYWIVKTAISANVCDRLKIVDQSEWEGNPEVRKAVRSENARFKKMAKRYVH